MPSLSRLVALLAALSCTPALADQFNTTQGGGNSPGGVLQRRQGTSGIIAVPVDENNPLPVTGGGGSVTTSPGTRTLVTLDVKLVTTGGTAVTAIAAGHRTAGGFIQNPGAPNAVNLCINEIGTATGTTTNGDTICIPPGASYTVSPTAGAVSVVSSDANHAFGGMGIQ
jgi:hypothetical protein